MSRPISIVCAALWCALGPVVWAHGDLHEAIEAVSKVIAKSPASPALYLRRAELHRLHQDWTAAEADYAHVRELQPDLDVVAFCRAEMRVDQGRETEALKLLDGFLSTHPDHPAARALRAGILERRGDWTRADADLAVAVSSSTEPHYATMRAKLLERHGRPAAAAECLVAASRAHGRVPVLEQQALEIEECAGRTDAALRRLDDLIAIEARRDIWLARKARLLENAGRTPEAGEAWRQAAAAFEEVPPDRRTQKLNCELAADIAAGLDRTPPNSP